MTMRALCLSCVAGISFVFSVIGGEPRTDINPALQYYQAFLLTPQLEQADRELLYANEMPGTKLPEKFGELMTKYDGQFNMVRQAAHATVPCDWGIDLSTGSATLLPHLARGKAVVQTARLRAMWDLQQKRPTDACDDLVAALALGRNCGQNGIMISVLVQIAMEAIVCSSVAENFGRFSAETLERLIEGFDAKPTRATLAASIPLEKILFRDRAVDKILQLRTQNAGNEAAVMEGIHQLLAPDRQAVEGIATVDTTNEQRARWESITRAAEGTSDGILKLLDEREQFYTQLETFMALPYSGYQAQIQQFTNKIEHSTNPFAVERARTMIRARTREFRILATLEMVRAAVEYKLHGEAGLQKITDPCGKGPFAFRRFVFEGVDRGFVLKSAFNLDGDDSGALIFVEKEGPPFRVSGRQIGAALSKESTEDVFRRRYGIEPRK